MKALNTTRGTIVAQDLKKVTSFIDKCLGLLLKNNPRSLLFKTHFGVHTFGLKTPTDLVVLNNELKVVKLGISISPNKLFFWNPKYKFVLELPDRRIKTSGTQIGDCLKIIDE